MLLAQPLFYFKHLLKIWPNSYLAEDGEQIIIGIDCAYLSGDDLNELKAKLNESAKEFNQSDDLKFAWFAGLFGLLSYEAVYKFEKLGDKKPALYKMPVYCYAKASAYLYYDKHSKIYECLGDQKYFKDLQNLQNPKTNEQDSIFCKILSDLDAQKQHFKSIIEEAKEYIKSGDIFQVVLSKTLHLYSNLDPLVFYECLKNQNPSHYMYYYPTPFGVVAGSSPELVMKIKGDEIFVSPIAGTRARGIDANDDERLAQDLLNDEKELAEHKMLVDLARNDVGKFAVAGSVRVKDLMHIERFESVMHIVSDVYAKKDKKFDNFDVLSVVFPAGTLSGSPKIRAMQIINELETHARGIYGGGIGFWHFNGDMQMAILIRSAMFKARENAYDVYIGAGAGIVYDSDANAEYIEICNKRKSCQKIFTQFVKNK